MSRLQVPQPSQVEKTVGALCRDLGRRLAATPGGLCPVDLCLGFLRLCHAQTCGKCVPCRNGLGRLAQLLEDILDGRGGQATLAQLETLAQVIRDSADCALGSAAAELVLKNLAGCREDYLSHLEQGRCLAQVQDGIPCREHCPSHVNIPGYIALVGAGRYEEAVALIRQDNPFPAACALICEHPCELGCRRQLLDAPLNIRALKRCAVDGARGGQVPPPFSFPATGKKVAIVGGGPSGLTCAYYLQLMGHSCTLFEARRSLGGMLRYGVPAYRLPREQLDADIAAILATGVEVHLNTSLCAPGGPSLEQLRQDYDAVYLALGAHGDKKLRIPGEEGDGVSSAVALLRDMGDEKRPQLEGKRVVVVGGGNVAMDCARTCIRLGAAKTYIVYRRRQEDMTALPEEVQAALAEGAELVELAAPLAVEVNEEKQVTAFIAQPQRIGPVDAGGRPKPLPATAPPLRIPCEEVVVAVGQALPTELLQALGLPNKWGSLAAAPDGSFADQPGLFAGGDCVSGPDIVIQAIAAGKAAAANIDAYLGYQHRLPPTVQVPGAEPQDHPAWGRAEEKYLAADQRRCSFHPVALALSREEACQEACRCLRCDAYGSHSLEKGGDGAW